MIADYPFGPPVPEIPLPEAPLLRVVAQIRFPVQLSIPQEETGARLQALLGPDYPVLRAEEEVGVVLSGGQISQAPTSRRLWRLYDKSQLWQITFGVDFVALVTERYKSRADFLGRLRTVLEALAMVSPPPTLDRIGLRYVDRVEGAASEELSKLLRPEVAGLLDVPLGPAGVRLHQYITAAEFDLGDGRGALTRWGVLPAGVTWDPFVVPATVPSWLLDLDFYSGGETDFDVTRIVSRVQELAEDAHRFFRWSVNADFLRVYGGVL